MADKETLDKIKQLEARIAKLEDNSDSNAFVVVPEVPIDVANSLSLRRFLLNQADYIASLVKAKRI
jgi:hypothetical protein